MMHAMASEASGKPVGGVPDISMSAAQFQEAIRKYYQDAGTPVPTQASDVLGLAEVWLRSLPRSMKTSATPLPLITMERAITSNWRTAGMTLLFCCKGIENVHRQALEVTNVACGYDESADSCRGGNHGIFKQLVRSSFHQAPHSRNMFPSMGITS